MTVKFNGFVIRTFQVGDEASLALNANNYSIWEMMRDMFPHPYTYDDATEWVKQNLNIEKPFNFAIDIDGDVVGCIGIIPGSDIYAKNVQIGYWLGKNHWNNGIITQAVTWLLPYCFNTLEINKVWASVFAGNKASIKVLQKCGFNHEATLKKNIYKNGKYIDELIFSVLQ